MPGAAASSSSICSSETSESLWPWESKNLTPLYSGGLCDAEMTTPRSSAKQRDRGRRKHAAENAVTARGDHTARKRLFELDAGRAGVTADEDLRSAGPERCRAAQTLDQLGREELAHDATHPIGAEVLARHDERVSAC